MWKRTRSSRRDVPSQGRGAPEPGTPGPSGTTSPGAPAQEAPVAPGSHAAPRTETAVVPDTIAGRFEFAVRSTHGSTRAGEAPEQREDALPPRSVDAHPLSRADRVGDALDRWSTIVAATSAGPSFLTQMRSGTVLDLTHGHPSGLAQLLAGRGATRLSSLVREVGALADARALAREIRETAERQAEEVGMTSCHLGIGEATWSPVDGGEPLHAPVLVRPLELRLRGNAREDVDLEIDATVEVNPVLLRALREAGVGVDARALLATTEGPYGFDPTPVLDAFRALGQPLPGFAIHHALVVGNLMDTAAPLAEDLRTDIAQWVAHPLVATLAGDPDAREELAASAPRHHERVDPQTLVAAVDPDHEAALSRVLDGGHLSIAAPPGTGTLDLVVDLMAELTARGRSVLVVSPRRRSLARIAELARARGLDELLFDLSPDPALQRHASEALLTSLRRAGSFEPSGPLAEPDELREARATLSGHVEAMHRVQQPWGVSAHEAISALAALTRLRPAPRTGVRLDADVAARMVGADRERFAEDLREAAACGALSAEAEDSAWFGATITTATQAERAIEIVDELRVGILPRLRERSRAVSGELGLSEVERLSDLDARLELLERVRGVLDVLHAAVFSAPLDDMIAATADRAWRADRGIEQSWFARRRLRRDAAALLRTPGPARELHHDLVAARSVRDAWAEAARGAQVDDTAPRASRGPRLPQELDQVIAVARRARTACDELAVLLSGTPAGGELAGTPYVDLAARLDALHSDADSLESLPRHTTVLRRLEFDGLGSLVQDLRRRRVGEAQVADELELAWWRSVLELIAGAEPTISQYDGTSLSAVAERFRTLDAEHIARSADRVRAASDDVLVATMKRFPDTSRAAIAELVRSSTTSVRDLAAKYQDILFRARPLWLASPYLVPQILPRGPHFDVVIMADGGRLPTWAALPAIARAEQTVVVGDPLEYTGEDQPSLLDEMLDVAPSLALRRDPHPATGGVRAFAQRRALDPDVIAVPSPVAPDPDRLVFVEDARGPVSEGADHVESTEAELRRVTDLVLEHARTRPQRSLAVVTLTPSHARAVLSRVLKTVAVLPLLRDFFDPEQTEAFTVVCAEQAAGLVRDDVIVSLGFGKTPHGRVIHRFGPLSGPRGREALLSTLTCARGRTTVVSGLAAEDLDATRLRTTGARDLRALLAVLATGEDHVDPAASEPRPGEDDTDARDDVEDTEPAAPETPDDAEPVAPDAGEAGEGEREDDAREDADEHETHDGEVPGDEAPAPSPSSASALVADLADRLWRHGLIIDTEHGLTEDRIELALAHPDLPGRYLVAVDTDGDRYVATTSQRERDRLRSERLEAAGWTTERVWSWALFIDPEGEAERIRSAVEAAYERAMAEGANHSTQGVGSPRHRLPRPQIPPGQPLSAYGTEDFDAVVDYLCSDNRPRLDEQLAAEVRAFLGFERRSVLLDVSVASAIRRRQERR